MQENNKIWILISDGLGVRNFAYTNMHLSAAEFGFNLAYWNNTIFRLEELGLSEEIIRNPKINPLTDVYKKAIIESELSSFKLKTGSSVYDKYRFPFLYQGVKSQIKEWLTSGLTKIYGAEEDILKLRKKIKSLERKTAYYKECVVQLKNGKPSLVFNTSQRHVTSIAPILAAQDCGIPTVTFIFSWDNLPKATLVVESDYYFVWSEYMKSQLLFYHPFIKSEQVYVTGTTQFDWHVQPSFLTSRKDFMNSHQLDPSKKYVCFSGDDMVTSPNDPAYLKDLAQTVRKLNKDGLNLGIIFRRCPVDFSDRYSLVEQEFKDVIFPVLPRWKKLGKDWNFVLPEKHDLALLANICHHSEFVFNVGSSMVFDFSCHDNKCFFLNYDPETRQFPDWKISNVYRFIHFESMPSNQAVGWVNSKEDFETIILRELASQDKDLNHTKKWFEKINVHPISETHQRFFNAFTEITNLRKPV